MTIKIKYSFYYAENAAGHIFDLLGALSQLIKFRTNLIIYII